MGTGSAPEELETQANGLEFKFNCYGKQVHVAKDDDASYTGPPPGYGPGECGFQGRHCETCENAFLSRCATCEPGYRLTDLYDGRQECHVACPAGDQQGGDQKLYKIKMYPAGGCMFCQGSSRYKTLDTKVWCGKCASGFNLIPKSATDSSIGVCEMK